MAQITLTLPDGTQRQYDAGKSLRATSANDSPNRLAKAISAPWTACAFLIWPWAINTDADIAIHKTMADEDKRTSWYATTLPTSWPAPLAGPVARIQSHLSAPSSKTAGYY